MLLRFYSAKKTLQRQVILYGTKKKKNGGRKRKHTLNCNASPATLHNSLFPSASAPNSSPSAAAAVARFSTYSRSLSTGALEAGPGKVAASHTTVSGLARSFSDQTCGQGGGACAQARRGAEVGVFAAIIIPSGSPYRRKTLIMMFRTTTWRYLHAMLLHADR